MRTTSQCWHLVQGDGSPWPLTGCDGYDGCYDTAAAAAGGRADEISDGAAPEEITVCARPYRCVLADCDGCSVSLEHDEGILHASSDADLDQWLDYFDWTAADGDRVYCNTCDVPEDVTAQPAVSLPGPLDQPLPGLEP